MNENRSCNVIDISSEMGWFEVLMLVAVYRNLLVGLLN